jgi:hypothetical protein
MASYSAPINITFKEIYFLVLTRDITSVMAEKEVNDREEIMTLSFNVELKKIPSITQRRYFILPDDQYEMMVRVGNNVMRVKEIAAFP